ncbi:MAG TPA: tetratricopeptide repeat protein [Thermoanaerobaculia bacterium]|nr:tetratricopeptide repeat protein [Thermoanaerobaculia bacterium]
MFSISVPRLMQVAALVVLLAVPASAGPRVMFVRRVPAPHDLGPVEKIVVLYAIGDNPRLDAFLDVFLEHANRTALLRIEMPSERPQHMFSSRPDKALLKDILSKHPADAYIGVNAFTCATEEKSADWSDRSADGARLRTKQQWADAICSARMDVISADAKRQTSFTVRGEGTSPRVVGSLTGEERGIALDQAARYAAISAAEGITPRLVRESIELDESAPAFIEGLSMIDASRNKEARAIWEAALRQHHDSAPLYYNLGAICEALGDVPAASRYFEEAKRLSPKERRYGSELDLFRHRNSVALAKRK